MECWVTAAVSLGLPSAAAAWAVTNEPDSWGVVFFLWGVACVFLLSLLAGTDFVWPAGDEFDLFTRIGVAFTSVCGPLPWIVSITVGAMAGAAIHEATKSSS